MTFGTDQNEDLMKVPNDLVTKQTWVLRAVLNSLKNYNPEI